VRARSALRQGGAALAALALAPVAAGALGLRPRWRRGLGERLGRAPAAAPGAVWVHGSSVGEALAAARLVDRLRKHGRRVVASAFTPAGRDALARRLPDVPCHLAPLDHPWCVAAALRRVRPAALVLIEGELWPGWIAEARRRGVPVVCVSGRVSDRSYRRYRRLERWVGRTLRRIEAIGARTLEDRDRFIALGADPERVWVTGDLKLALEDAPRPLAPDLARALGDTPLVVAGSTRRGEEAAALEALSRIERFGLASALVLAPRQMRRVDEVLRLARAAGRTAQRRSELGGEARLRAGESGRRLCAGESGRRLRAGESGRRLRAGEVLVLDTLGELAAVYGRAAAAFVGGSLVPQGGHNVVEPVLAGCPVVYGRHTGNVRHAVELLERCGAGRRVDDAVELGFAFARALRDPEGARARGEAARRTLTAHRDSAERAAELVESVLAGAGARR